MMVGLMQFIYRLLNPIEENNPRMYHFDIAMATHRNVAINTYMLSIYYCR